MNNRRRRVTYANVASTLALVLALSGVAYAAATVTSADIVNKTIKTADMSSKARKALLPQARQAYRNDGGTLTGNDSIVVGSLGLTKGSWVVTAKLWLRNDGSGSSDVVCELRSVNDSDIVWSRIAPSGGIASPSFSLMHTGSDRAEVICNPNGGTIHAFDLKITAVKVGKTTQINLSGP